MQTEINELKQTLRKLQFEPPSVQQDSQLREKLDQAMFDNEALKLLLRDFKAENDRLKAGSVMDGVSPMAAKPPLRIIPRTNFESPMNRSQKLTSESPFSPSPSSKWAYPSDSERSAFVNKLKSYEETARLSPTPSPTKRHNRTSTTTATPVTSTKRHIRNATSTPTTYLQETDTQSLHRRQSSNTTDSMPYFERKELLDNHLATLAQEKQQVLMSNELTFELSRIPSSGAKARQRQNEIEIMLDNVDKQMANTRRKMKDFGFL